MEVDEEAEKLPEVTIDGVQGQEHAFMRLAHPVQLILDGALGDYAFAFNELTDVQMTGNVGHGVGDGMKSGAVRIRGNAGEGAGCSMSGGTLAIYGSAGDRCGAAMRGGGIVLLVISFWPYILTFVGAYLTWLYSMLLKRT